MPEIAINREWCKGCYICVSVCPHRVLEVDQEAFDHGFHPVVAARPEDCTVCRQCELLCPDLAISVSDGQTSEVSMTSEVFFYSRFQCKCMYSVGNYFFTVEEHGVIFAFKPAFDIVVIMRTGGVA